MEMLARPGYQNDGRSENLTSNPCPGGERAGVVELIATAVGVRDDGGGKPSAFTGLNG